MCDCHKRECCVCCRVVVKNVNDDVERFHVVKV